MLSIYKNNLTFVFISIFFLFATFDATHVVPSAIGLDFPSSYSALSHHPSRRFKIFDSQC